MALIINGQRIDDEILEREAADIKSSYEAMDPYIQCCERDDEFRGYARDNIIARVLLSQEAERRIELDEAEIDQAVEQLKQEHGGEDRFYAYFNISADDEPMVRRDVADNLRVRKLIDQAADSSAEPDDDQLHAFYEQHIDAFMSPERVRASHILKNPTKTEERDEVYETMRQLRRQARDSADFAELARQHSDKVRELKETGEATCEDDGVDLGFFARGEIMPEIEAVAFSMELGEVSPVLHTQFGYHLLKLTERQDPAPRPFDEARDDVRQHYLQQRQDEAIEKLVEQLKADASIEEVENEADAPGETDETAPHSPARSSTE